MACLDLVVICSERQSLGNQSFDRMNEGSTLRQSAPSSKAEENVRQIHQAPVRQRLSIFT